MFGVNDLNDFVIAPNAEPDIPLAASTAPAKPVISGTLISGSLPFNKSAALLAFPVKLFNAELAVPVNELAVPVNELAALPIKFDAADVNELAVPVKVLAAALTLDGIPVSEVATEFSPPVTVVAMFEAKLPADIVDATLAKEVTEGTSIKRLRPYLYQKVAN